MNLSFSEVFLNTDTSLKSQERWQIQVPYFLGGACELWVNSIAGQPVNTCLWIYILPAIYHLPPDTDFVETRNVLPGLEGQSHLSKQGQSLCLRQPYLGCEVAQGHHLPSN